MKLFSLLLAAALGAVAAADETANLRGAANPAAKLETVPVEGDKTWSPECQHWRDKCGPMNHRTLQEAIAAGDKTWNGDCWHWKNKCGWTHRNLMEAVTVEGTEADKTWSPECQHWRDKCGPMNEAIAAGDKTWNGDCWHWKNKCGWTH